MDKTLESKFSIIGDTAMTEDPEYVELERFVWYLAWRNDNPDNVMMQAEDIASELLLELVKGIQHYRGLPHDQKLAVLRRMMDNRVAELRYRYYGTHRAQAKLSVSLETAPIDGDPSEALSPDDRIDANPEHTPEEAMESVERVELTRRMLDETAQRVFDAVVYGKEPRLANVLLMAMVRANAVYHNPNVTLKPRHVAEALLMSESIVKKAYKDIRRAYTIVCQDQEVLHG